MQKIALAAACLIMAVAPLAAAPPEPTIAVFDLQLINTSGAPDTPEELARTKQLTEQLRNGLAEPGRYRVVSTAPVQAEIARGPLLQNCKNCSLDAARKLGADYAAHGWVQKVSNLILSITLVVEDVATGKTVYGNSVDIRSNTNDSWFRGMRYMLNEQMFRDGVRPGSKVAAKSGAAP